MCVVIAVPVLAQQRAAADPVTGTWAGDWGPNASDRNQVSVDLKLDGKNVTGVVKTANRAEVAISKGTFDAAAGGVHLEAEAKNPRSGQAVHYVIDGKLANGVITGTWNHDAVKGDFKITKK
jgi:hypothetical protein